MTAYIIELYAFYCLRRALSSDCSVQNVLLAICSSMVYYCVQSRMLLGYEAPTVSALSRIDRTAKAGVHYNYHITVIRAILEFCLYRRRQKSSALSTAVYLENIYGSRWTVQDFWLHQWCAKAAFNSEKYNGAQHYCTIGSLLTGVNVVFVDFTCIMSKQMQCI